VPFVRQRGIIFTAGQETVDNMIQRMRFVCWKPKVTDAGSDYVILTAFPRDKNG